MTLATHNWNLLDPYANNEADDAAYMAGCAKTRLYGVQGEERADPAAAYRSLWFAEQYLRDAIRHVKAAKTRIGCEHGLDDSQFGLKPEAPAEDCVSIVIGKVA